MRERGGKAPQQLPAFGVPITMINNMEDGTRAKAGVTFASRADLEGINDLTQDLSAQFR